MRKLTSTHGDLAKRLAELEEKTEALSMRHNTFNRDPRNQLQQVFDALREPTTPSDALKPPVAVRHSEDKSKKIPGATGGS